MQSVIKAALDDYIRKHGVFPDALGMGDAEKMEEVKIFFEHEMLIFHDEHIPNDHFRFYKGGFHA